ncbi:hypothetical protein CC1G_15298 [Coprinopsis cinerea okayama7|uniref:Uncharacterized protein n=1 Tax=Coprinopsis cinerea (strain Okayama-7 / 130 / ATCC MYA-4618 / FGSC 9003) TaxID=240176 RepID=D6RPX7_COPC7|nr:hypothetical protein CC1G_15298 [Coprinopsis cinerea okayama7\|eukprot:XP_002910391.1 hypothetical protein CC1G_15298 [Coprinopsis cinerea okayama7\
MSGRSSTGPDTPTPGPPYTHSHSNSTTTVTAPTPPPHTTQFVPQQPQPAYNRSPLILAQMAAAQSRLAASGNTNAANPTPNGNANVHPQSSQYMTAESPDHLSTGQSSTGSVSPNRSAGDSSGSSPTPSSNGYSTSISRSPSPASPSSQPTSPPRGHHHPGHLGHHPSHLGHQQNGKVNVNVGVVGEEDAGVEGFATSFSALTVREEGDGEGHHPHHHMGVVPAKEYLIEGVGDGGR